MLVAAIGNCECHGVCDQRSYKETIVIQAAFERPLVCLQGDEVKVARVAGGACVQEHRQACSSSIGHADGPSLSRALRTRKYGVQEPFAGANFQHKRFVRGWCAC